MRLLRRGLRRLLRTRDGARKGATGRHRTEGGPLGAEHARGPALQRANGGLQVRDSLQAAHVSTGAEGSAYSRGVPVHAGAWLRRARRMSAVGLFPFTVHTRAPSQLPDTGCQQASARSQDSRTRTMVAKVSRAAASSIVASSVSFSPPSAGLTSMSGGPWAVPPGGDVARGPSVGEAAGDADAVRWPSRCGGEAGEPPLEGGCPATRPLGRA